MIEKIILFIFFIHFIECIYTFKDNNQWFRFRRQSDLIINEHFASGDYIHSNIQNVLFDRLKKPRSFDCDEPLDIMDIINGETEDITNILKFVPKNSELHSHNFHVFTKTLEKIFSLRRIPIAGDGNCGFRSILVAAGESLKSRYPAGEKNYGQLRADIVEYVKNRKQHYETIFENTIDLVPWINTMQKNGEWLDEVGLRAASELIRLQIVVFRPIEIIRIFEPCDNQSIIQTVYILHNGQNHYEALLPEMKDGSSTIESITKKQKTNVSPVASKITPISLASSCYSFNLGYYYLFTLELYLIKRFLQ